MTWTSDVLGSDYSVWGIDSGSLILLKTLQQLILISCFTMLTLQSQLNEFQYYGSMAENYDKTR